MTVGDQQMPLSMQDSAELVLPQFPDVHIRLVFAQEQNKDIPKRVREILQHSYLERMPAV